MANKPVLRLRTAIAGWIIVSLWFAFLIAMSLLALRDGMPGVSAEISSVVFGVFYLFGIVGAAHVFGAPCTSVWDCGGEIEVREHWLLKSRVHRLPRRRRPSIDVARSNDGADSSFTLYIDVGDGKTVPVAFAHDEADIEKARNALTTLWPPQ